MSLNREDCDSRSYHRQSENYVSRHGRDSRRMDRSEDSRQRRYHSGSGLPRESHQDSKASFAYEDCHSEDHQSSSNLPSSYGHISSCANHNATDQPFEELPQQGAANSEKASNGPTYPLPIPARGPAQETTASFEQAFLEDIEAGIQPMPTVPDRPPAPVLQYDSRGRVLKSSFLSNYSGPKPGAYASVRRPSPNNGQLGTRRAFGHLGTSRLVAEEENEETNADEATGATLSSLDESDHPITLEGAREEETPKLWHKKSCLVVLAFAFLLIVVVASVIALVVLQSNSSSGLALEEQGIMEEGPAEDEMGFSLVPNMSNQTMAALADPHSQQYQAYDFISKDPNWDTYEDWRKQQRFAMACFCYALRKQGGFNDHVDLHPKSYSHECDWIPGVDLCDGNDIGVVTALKLSHTSVMEVEVEGHMTPELSYLGHLKVLDLSHLKVQPSLEELLPTETLRSLPPSLVELRLRDCQLEGSIPSTLGLVTSLTHLDLSMNSLTSSIPSELGLLSNLSFLALSGNLLSGTVPDELEDLQPIIEFALEDNPEGGASDFDRENPDAP